MFASLWTIRVLLLRSLDERDRRNGASRKYVVRFGLFGVNQPTEKHRMILDSEQGTEKEVIENILCCPETHDYL